MAGDNPVIGIDVEASLAQLREELAKIPDIGAKEARALTGALAREFRGAERAAANAAKATAGAAKQSAAGLSAATVAADGFRESARGMAERTEKIAGALTLVSPEAGKTAIAVGYMAKAATVAAEAAKAAGVSMAALAGPIAAVATVVGLATFAWRLHAREVAEANRRQEEAKAAAEALRPTLEATEDLLLRAAAATGQVADEEVRRHTLTRQAQRDYDRAIEADEKRIEALEKIGNRNRREQGELLAVRARLTEAAGAHALRVRSVDLLIAAEEHQRQARERATREERAGQEAARDGERAAVDLARAYKALGDSLPQREYEETTDRLEEWERALTSAGRLTEAARAQLRALRVDAVDKLEASLEALAEAQDNATQATAREQRDAAAVRLNAEVVARRELRDIVIGTMEGEEAALARLVAARDDAKARAIDAAREAGASNEDLLGVLVRIDEAYARNAESAEMARDRHEEAALALRDALAGLWGGISDAVAESYDRQVEAGKVSAREAFEVQRALALVQAGINAAVAISNVWREWAGTPQVAAALTGVAAAAVGIQIAAIASQEAPLYVGGMVDRDGQRAVLHRDEGVLSQQGVRAMGGPAAVERANRGEMGATAAPVVIVMHDDRVLAVQVQRALRRGGGPWDELRYGGRNLPGSYNPYERRV